LEKLLILLEECGKEERFVVGILITSFNGEVFVVVSFEKHFTQRSGHQILSGSE